MKNVPPISSIAMPTSLVYHKNNHNNIVNDPNHHHYHDTVDMKKKLQQNHPQKPRRHVADTTYHHHMNQTTSTSTSSAAAIAIHDAKRQSVESSKRTMTLTPEDIALAEKWLLQGGCSNNSSSHTTNVSANHQGRTNASSSSVSSNSYHGQRVVSKDHSRGRSPTGRNHNINPSTSYHDSIVVSEESNIVRTHRSLSKSRGHDTTNMISTTSVDDDQQQRSSIYIIPTSGTTATNSVSSNHPISPKPIPKEYISHIMKVYGHLHHRETINLYTDVLDLPPLPSNQNTNYTIAQIRVAYFRKGRYILQNQHTIKNGSPTSTVLSYPQNTSISTKQQFRAITKAYEIVTNPSYKAYYDMYGLRQVPASPKLTTKSSQHPIVVDYGTPPNNNLQQNCYEITTTQSTKKIVTPITSSSPTKYELEDDRNDDHPNHNSTTSIEPAEKNYVESHHDYDETISVASSTNNSSCGSILRRTNTNQQQRRSRSWGPSSSSHPRVVWKEYVQELIYQPDPPAHTYPDGMMEGCTNDSPPRYDMHPSKYKMKHHRSKSFTDYIMHELHERDILDDIEASVDGIHETIGNFVKYLSDDESIIVGKQRDDDYYQLEQQHLDDIILQSHSKYQTHPEPNNESNNGQTQPSRTQQIICSKDDDDDDNKSCDSSQIARQLFADLTKKPTQSKSKLVSPTMHVVSESKSSSSSSSPNVSTVNEAPPQEQVSPSGGAYTKRIANHRRCHSNDGKQLQPEFNATTTTTAPLKQGKLDQTPRIKPKKLKKKHRCRRVDKVPSEDEQQQRRSIVDSVFDPFQNSIDGSTDKAQLNLLMDAWNEQFGVRSPSGNDTIQNNDSATQAVGMNILNKNTLEIDPYALPEESSIIVSVDGTLTDPSITKLDLGESKAISFDDALNETTYATTKGILRLDRFINDRNRVSTKTIQNATTKDAPILDISDITFSSKASDDPAGRHFHGFLSTFTKSAKTTIQEIASFDEIDGIVTTNDITSNEINSKSTNPNANKDEDTLFSQFNGYMQSFIQDMNQLGAQISTNLGEANRVVQETITFPETEVAGMLRIIETDWNFTENKSPANASENNTGDLNKSFTY